MPGRKEIHVMPVNWMCDQKIITLVYPTEVGCILLLCVFGFM